MKKLIIKVMKFTVKWGLWTLLCSLLGCIASRCSGSIITATDYTQEATVGIISRRGFPVWFYEAAPGISIMGGWRFDRFDANCYVWTAFFLAIVVFIACVRYFIKQRRGQRQQCLEQKKTRWGRFVESKGHVFLLIGSVLLPLFALVFEWINRRSLEYISVDPLATPWNVIGVAFIPIGYLVLWLAVCTRLRFPARWLHYLAVVNGIALMFSAFYVFLLEHILLDLILTMELLSDFWVEIILTFLPVPPVFLMHTPLVAFICGCYLFQRLYRMAKQENVFVSKSLCVGILIGVGSILVFYAFGLDKVSI